MTDEKSPFSLNLNRLKSREKPSAEEVTRKTDTAAAELGFPSRQTHGRSRPASPRDGQVHARVLPHVAKEISAEAKRRGVQQGVLIEEAWALYCKANELA